MASKAAQPSPSSTSKKPRKQRKQFGKHEAIQRRARKNLLRGMPKQKALIEAGYKPSYVERESVRIIRRLLVSSPLTDAVQELLTEEKKEYKDIVRPYVDALSAPIIVKSSVEGIACIAVDADTQQVIPDHDIRMRAATHIVSLMGGVPKEVEMPAAPQKGLTIIISQEGGSMQVNQQTNIVPDHTTIQPTGTTKVGGGGPKVRIEQA